MMSRVISLVQVAAALKYAGDVDVLICCAGASFPGMACVLCRTLYQYNSAFYARPMCLPSCPLTGLRMIALFLSKATLEFAQGDS